MLSRPFDVEELNFFDFETTAFEDEEYVERVKVVQENTEQFPDLRVEEDLLLAILPVAYGTQPAARKTARELQVQGATCGRRNSGERRHELSAGKPVTSLVSSFLGSTLGAVTSFLPTVRQNTSNVNSQKRKPNKAWNFGLFRFLSTDRTRRPGLNGVEASLECELGQFRLSFLGATTQRLRKGMTLRLNLGPASGSNFGLFHFLFLNPLRGPGLGTPGSGGRVWATLGHPWNEILVSSVSHSGVHHLTPPEEDDLASKSEPRGSGDPGWKSFVTLCKRVQFEREDSQEFHWKLWIPEALTSTLIQQAHEGENRMRGGIAKTLARLKQFYYWTRITVTVRDLVVVHTDNGKQFTSSEFGALIQHYGIKHVRTAFYSPQANAYERVNQSVIAAIRTHIGADQTTWDEKLPEIQAALCSAIHSSNGVSPYFALFGQNMFLHGNDYAVARRLGALEDAAIAPLARSEKHKSYETAEKRSRQQIVQQPTAGRAQLKEQRRRRAPPEERLASASGWPQGKLYSHQQNKQQKDPGSGPGVPALHETDTSTPSPSVGPTIWTDSSSVGHVSPSPFYTRKVSRALFRFQIQEHGKMQQKRFKKKTAEEQWDKQLSFRIGCCKMHPLCTEKPWEKEFIRIYICRRWDSSYCVAYLILITSVVNPNSVGQY
ncbi:hypothetical protein ACLKA6_018700 [Drosophila palustris]